MIVLVINYSFDTCPQKEEKKSCVTLCYTGLVYSKDQRRLLRKNTNLEDYVWALHVNITYEVTQRNLQSQIVVYMKERSNVIK